MLLNDIKKNSTLRNDQALSVEGFQSFQCCPANANRFFARRVGDLRVVAELMPMVRLLCQRPTASFADLDQLKAEACDTGAAPPTAAAIRAMRDLFLEIPNAQLQRLYKAHFRAFPPASATPHQEKIAALDSLQETAQGIVAAFDWRWLADWLRLDLIDETAETCLLRLSNFAFAVKRVNFRFTYHCNIACRHCYNSSGPHAKAQRIDLEAMLRIIEQMPGGNVFALNVTGGEPFLYPDDLMILIAAGRAARLNEISIYTNGFWATTPEKAHGMLARLATAGLMQAPNDHLKVSTGVYHQEFIEFDCIATLARCYHEAFGRRLLVDFEVAPGNSNLAQSIRQKMTAAGLSHCISLDVRTTAPLGRGQNLEGAVNRQIEQPCRVIDQIVYDADGTARPCCGLNNDNHGIRIGQLETHGLRDLVKRMQNDPILQFLASNPMSAIFQHVAVQKNEAGYAGNCNLCQHALGDLTDKEELQSRLFEQQEFYPFWFALPSLTRQSSDRSGSQTLV